MKNTGSDDEHLFDWKLQTSPHIPENYFVMVNEHEVMRAFLEERDAQKAIARANRFIFVAVLSEDDLIKPAPGSAPGTETPH